MNRIKHLARGVALPRAIARSRLLAGELFAGLFVALFLALPPAARAERVTQQEALTVAENYIQFILRQDGQWGEHATARVVSIDPFQRGDRVLGYYCSVEPVGYFVLALDRELAPIRAYSVRHDLDPNAEGGMTALLKDRLERLYSGIERKLGHVPGASEDFGAAMPVDFRPVWQALTAADFDPARYVEQRKSRATGMNYQEGETLVRTTWSQEPPYNDQCPNLGCVWSDYGYHNSNAYVGCVATAGAQVMKYWNWPPTGNGGIYADAYDWPNMTDMYWYDGNSDCFRDGQWEQVTAAQMAAVAEISAEVGQAVGMSYGCGGSGAPTLDMEGVYQNQYRYDSECDVRYIEDYSYATWFTLLKNEFNMNRPVQYRIPGHSIVSDGWKEELIGGQYEWIHVVYGWNGGNDGWFAPDEIPGGNPNDEYVVREIYPDCALGDVIAGIIGGGTYGYVYFNRDVTSAGAAIGPSVKAQVLRAGFVLENTGPSANIVAFYGQPAANTLVFLDGDEDGGGRIRVNDGQLFVRSGGQLVIH